MSRIIKYFPFLRTVLLNIRHRFWISKTNKAVSNYLRGHGSPKLQLGAGQNLLEGWFNTDYFPRKNIYFLDVTKPFPVPSSSFGYVYTEHHIEHISYKHAVFMLKECFRILKPGGLIRIATPDLHSAVVRYLKLEDDKFPGQKNHYLYSGFHNAVNYIPVDNYDTAHELNDMFYNYDHQFIYDFEALKRVLQHAGFAKIEDRSRQILTDGVFFGIDSHSGEFDKYYTLIVEAEKV